MIDWGSVPAWVGSILTSGSLALGFYIILRDRRKDERAQAQLIAVQSHSISSITSPVRTASVSVHNNSGAAIFDAVFLLVPLPSETLRKNYNNYETEIDRVEAVQKDQLNWDGYLSGRELQTLEELDINEENFEARPIISAGASKTLNMESEFNPTWYTPHLLFVDAVGQPWDKNAHTKELRKFSVKKFKDARGRWTI